MKFKLPTTQTLFGTLRSAFWVWTPLVGILIWRAWSLTSNAIADERDSLAQQQVSAVTEAREAITGRLIWAHRDIRHLASEPSLKRFLVDPVNTRRQDVIDSFVSLMESRVGIYAQARYLDASGQEIVRVDNVRGVTVVVPDTRLQNKSDRYYFAATRSLPADRYNYSPSQVQAANAAYLSQMDLNVENGRVEEPYTPVLRVGSRVFGDSQRDAGIVILNYLGQPILDRIGSVSGTKRHNQPMWLLNSEGHWMLGPDRDVEWGFMFPDKPTKTMEVRLPDVWRAISGNASTGVESGALPEGMFAFHRYVPSHELSGDGYVLTTNPKNSWYLVAWYSQQDFDARIQPLLVRYGLNFVGLFLLICVVSVMVGFGIHRRLLAEATVKLTNASLRRANQDLESFSYSVAHDLRTPLRSVDGFSKILLLSYASRLDDTGKDYLQRMRNASQRMGQMIDDILALSRLSRAEVRRKVVDLSAVAGAVLQELRAAEPERRVDVRIESKLLALADENLVRVVFDNLLGNAWKFTGRTDGARIQVGKTGHGGQDVFFVRDNGAGFDMAYAQKLFGAFQRLHQPGEFPGTGIGLATVQRVVHKHGGEIWAESTVGHGATFYFTFYPSLQSGDSQ